MFYVYILESEIDGDFYKGSTEDYVKRLAEHNRGESQFTRSKMPWKLIFVRKFNDKRAPTGAVQLKNTTLEDSGPGLIRDALGRVARDIVKELAQILK